MNTTTASPVAPLLPTVWWGILIRILVAISVMFTANLARVPFHRAAESQMNGDWEVYANAVIFFLTPVLVVAFVWAWMRWVERRPITVLQMWDVRATGTGLAGGIGIVGIAMATVWLYAWWAGLALGKVPVDSLTGPTGDTAGVSIGAVLVLLVARSLVLQGIPEELLFRGWLWDVMRRSPWIAFAWATVGFTLPHLFSSGGQQDVADHLVYLAIPLGMSVLGGAVVLRCGNFWWAAGTHGGVHLWLGVLSAIWPMELGQHLWAAIGLAQILVGFVVLVLAVKRPAAVQPGTRREVISENAL